MGENYYELLSISPRTSFADIDKAYNRLSDEYRHQPARLQAVTKAWKVLSNPIKRSRYDRELAKGKGAEGQPAARESSPSGGESPTSGGFTRSATEIIDVVTDKDVPPRRSSRTEVIDVPQGIEGESSEESPASGSSEGTGPSVPDSEMEHTHYRRSKTEVIEVETDSGAPDTGQEHRPKTEVIETPVDKDEQRGKRASTEVIPVPDAENQEAAPDAEQAQGEATVVEQRTAHDRIEVSYEGRTQQYSLSEKDFLIGRPSRSGPQPDIGLADPRRYISRKHARLEFRGGQYLIVDQGSVNGTYLNGKRLPAGERQALEDGDLIEIEGRELRIRLGEGDA